MRAIILVGSLVLLPADALADENKKSPPLPVSAQKAVSDAEAEVERARKRFEAEENAIRVKLVAELQKLLEAETRKGNLDNAIAIRDQIERLKQAERKTDANPSLVAARKILVGGKWRFKVLGTPYQAEWEFNDDGTITNSDRNSADVKWTLTTLGKAAVLQVGATAYPLPLNPRRMVGVKTTSNEQVELVRLSNM